MYGICGFENLWTGKQEKYYLKPVFKEPHDYYVNSKVFSIRFTCCLLKEKDCESKSMD